MSATSATRTAQAPRRAIPKPDSPNALAVCDGTIGVGSIVEQDGIFFAYDATGALIGEYRTLREATRALPFANATVAARLSTTRRRPAA